MLKKDMQELINKLQTELNEKNKRINELETELKKLKEKYSKTGRPKKLNEKDIEMIKKLIKLGVPISKIAKDYNVTRKTIYAALDN